MSAVTPQELWSLWQLGEVMPKHVIGQVIQILIAQERLAVEYGVSLTRHEQQIEQLQKEVAQLRKLVKALGQALQALDGK